MSDEFQKSRTSSLEMRAIAKFEKRGRYEYSGFLEQEKYNYKPKLLQPAHDFC